MINPHRLKQRHAGPARFQRDVGNSEIWFPDDFSARNLCRHSCRLTARCRSRSDSISSRTAHQAAESGLMVASAFSRSLFESAEYGREGAWWRAARLRLPRRQQHTKVNGSRRLSFASARVRQTDLQAATRALAKYLVICRGCALRPLRKKQWGGQIAVAAIDQISCGCHYPDCNRPRVRGLTSRRFSCRAARGFN